jgi:hypothetical protein
VAVVLLLLVVFETSFLNTIFLPFYSCSGSLNFKSKSSILPINQNPKYQLPVLHQFDCFYCGCWGLFDDLETSKMQMQMQMQMLYLIFTVVISRNHIAFSRERFMATWNS